MAITETTEGFWPNVAAAPYERTPLTVVEPIALDTSDDPQDAVEEVAEAVDEPRDAIEEMVAEEVEAVDAPQHAVADVAETVEDTLDEVSRPELSDTEFEQITAENALLDELDIDHAEAFADVIDLGQFGTTFDEADTDHFHDGVTAEELSHLPVTDGTTLGGDNLAAVRALNPQGLAAHRDLEAAVMSATETLSTADRTLLGLVVSVENRCDYWQTHLSRRLEAWFDADRVDALATDWTVANLAVRDRAMLAFAVKLTLIPGQMTADDADLLVSVGFTERDLVDIVDVVAYWSFANRFVDGLGVFVEPGLHGHLAR